MSRVTYTWLVTSKVVGWSEQRWSSGGGSIVVSCNHRNICRVKKCTWASKAIEPTFRRSGQSEPLMCSHWLVILTRPGDNRFGLVYSKAGSVRLLFLARVEFFIRAYTNRAFPIRIVCCT